jgi:hypothetical protein
MDKTAAVGAGFPDRVVRAIMALVISKKNLMDYSHMSKKTK